MENYTDKYIEIEFKWLNCQLIDLSKNELINYCARLLEAIQDIEIKKHGHECLIDSLYEELESVREENETLKNVIKNINKALEVL